MKRFVRLLGAVGLCLVLTGCGAINLNPFNLPDLFDGTSRSGGVRGSKSYTVRGKTYVPLKSARNFKEEGMASWYGEKFHGRATASGERYNMHAMTAAHKILPLQTTVRVTNVRNGNSIVVRVNDRGPFISGRVIDLSYKAAKQLGMTRAGVVRVRVEAIDTR